MKTLKIAKGPLPGIILLPHSKSHANRALILSAISKQTCSIERVPQSTDVLNLISALVQVGLDIEVGKTLTIRNSFPDCERKSGAVVHVGEGGTTARFLASMLCLGSAPYVLILGERLKQRPWQEFIETVLLLGGKAVLNENQLHIQGPIILPETLEVDCKRTTQFASGMKLVTSKTKTKVVPINLNSSQAYWDMTDQMITQFQDNSIYTVPLDWSSASYPLAFGALNHPILFPELKVDPSQADSKFFRLLNELGAIDATAEEIKVIPFKTAKNTKMDVSDCLDLVPTLCFFLSHIPGHHELTNLGNLVYKESDRLSEVMTLLKTFQKKCHLKEQSLTIVGDNKLFDLPVDLLLPDDHRIVMAAALFLRHHAGGTISPAEAVGKSWPGFFEMMNRS